MSLDLKEGEPDVFYVTEARMEVNPFRLLKSTQYTVVQLSAAEGRRVQDLDRRIEEGKRQFDRESPGIADHGQKVRRYEELVGRLNQERRRLLEGQPGGENHPRRFLFSEAGNPRHPVGAILPKNETQASHDLVPYGNTERRLGQLPR